MKLAKITPVVLRAGCASVAALAVGITAHPAAAQTSDGAQQSGLLDEVVVTARRKAENLQDVPVAVTAYSAETLTSKGVRESADLSRVAPSLNVTATSTGGRARPSYELRGIFINDAPGAQDQVVGLYINDVYIARPSGTNQTFYDLENIQVLYGPQGTLFGRNTTAGAMLITSKRPTDRFEGEVSAGYGNYKAVELGGVINLPLTDWAKLRLAGQFMDNDGYRLNIRNNRRIDDDNHYSVRASLLLNPTDRFENYTTIETYRIKTHGWSVVTTSAVPVPTAANPNANLFLLPDGTAVRLNTTVGALYGQRIFNDIAASRARDPSRVWSDLDESTWGRTFTLGNTTTYNLTDDVVLKNIFGYRKIADVIKHDSDGLPENILGGNEANPNRITQNENQISDELQLQGKSFDGKLDWIVGAYVFRERTGEIQTSWTLIDTVAGATSPTASPTVATNNSKSVFAQGTYNLTDQLSATLGGRYTWDERRIVYDNAQRALGKPTQTCNLDAAFDSADGARDCFAARSAKFKEPTYTASLNYKPTDDILVYAAHRRGYRSGGFNFRALNEVQATPFKPETVRDVEFGFKGTFRIADDTVLRTNLALYKTWYDEIQRTVVIPIATGPSSVVINAAKATIKGFEFNADLQIVRGVTLSGSWGYVDAIHEKFVNAASPGGFARDIPFGSAKNSVNVGIQVTPIDNDETGVVRASLDYSYKSAFFATTDLPVVSPLERIAPRTLFNATVEWSQIMGSNVSARAWIRNLTNETYTTGSLGLLTSLGYVTETRGDPRTYGLTLRYAFGR